MKVKTLTYIHQLLIDAVEGIRDSYNGAKDEVKNYLGFHELWSEENVRNADKSVIEEYKRLVEYRDNCLKELRGAENALEEFEAKEW